MVATDEERMFTSMMAIELDFAQENVYLGRAGSHLLPVYWTNRKGESSCTHG